MAKIEVNAAAEILKRNQIAPDVLRRVVEEMNLAVQPDPVDGEGAPAVKKQFVILVSDPDGRLPKADFVGWVLQLPEGESVATTEERIRRATYDFNASKKGRLLPCKTVGESLENVPAKFFKEADVWVKTKTPVLMLRTDNEIPRDDTPARDRDEATSVEIRTSEATIQITGDGISATKRDVPRVRAGNAGVVELPSERGNASGDEDDRNKL